MEHLDFLVSFPRCKVREERRVHPKSFQYSNIKTGIRLFIVSIPFNNKGRNQAHIKFLPNCSSLDSDDTDGKRFWRRHTGEIRHPFSCKCISDSIHVWPVIQIIKWSLSQLEVQENANLLLSCGARAHVRFQSWYCQHPLLVDGDMRGFLGENHLHKPRKYSPLPPIFTTQKCLPASNPLELRTIG